VIAGYESKKANLMFAFFCTYGIGSTLVSFINQVFENYNKDCD